MSDFHSICDAANDDMRRRGCRRVNINESEPISIPFSKFHLSVKSIYLLFQQSVKLGGFTENMLHIDGSILEGVSRKKLILKYRVDVYYRRTKSQTISLSKNVKNIYFTSFN